MKIKINRKTWNRGNSSLNGYLFNGSEYDILGFILLKSRTIRTKEKLYNIDIVSSLSTINNSRKWKKLNDSHFLHKINFLNDNPGIGDKERETKLKKIFKTEFDIELEFIN